jgi:hypothetical protein
MLIRLLCGPRQQSDGFGYISRFCAEDRSLTHPETIPQGDQHQSPLKCLVQRQGFGLAAGPEGRGSNMDPHRRPVGTPEGRGTIPP